MLAADRVQALHETYVGWCRLGAYVPQREVDAAARAVADAVPDLLAEYRVLEQQVLRVRQLCSDDLYLHDRPDDDRVTVAELRAALDGKECDRG